MYSLFTKSRINSINPIEGISVI